jgi:hypothetical protein
MPQEPSRYEGMASDIEFDTVPKFVQEGFGKLRDVDLFSGPAPT